MFLTEGAHSRKELYRRERARDDRVGWGEISLYYTSYDHETCQPEPQEHVDFLGISKHFLMIMKD